MNHLLHTADGVFLAIAQLLKQVEVGSRSWVAVLLCDEDHVGLAGGRKSLIVSQLLLAASKWSGKCSPVVFFGGAPTRLVLQCCGLLLVL